MDLRPPYLSLLVDVPSEGDGIVRDLLNVANGVEALLVVGCGPQREESQWREQDRQIETEIDRERERESRRMKVRKQTAPLA